MKNILKTISILGIALFLNACEKDAGKIPNISFKTGGSYISADANVGAKNNFTIGISASKAEDKDVLKKFNISKSVNGGAAQTVYSQDLSGSDADNFSYDYAAAADSTVGAAAKYTFTVTNRDGLTNQVSLTITSN